MRFISFPRQCLLTWKRKWRKRTIQAQRVDVAFVPFQQNMNMYELSHMNKCGNVYFCKPVICLYLILKSHDYRQSFYTVTHCEPCVGCQKRGWRSPDFLSKSSQSTSFVATHTDRHCPEVSFQIPAVVKLTNVKILLSPNIYLIYILVSHLRILKPQSQTAVTGFAVF